MKKLFLFFFFLSIFITAQEQFNFKSDNYSGINGILLDPTHSISNPTNWDINLVSVDAFAHNNYSYISQTSILNLLLKQDLQIASPSKNRRGANTKRILDFQTNSAKKDAFVQVDVMGPSAAIRLNYQNVIGIYSRARAVVSARNIDNGFNYYNFHEINFENDFSLKKSDLQAASWLELGFNYTRVFSEDNEKRIALGATLKYLYGTDALYAKNLSDATLSVKKDTLTISKIDFEIGLASNSDLYNEDTANQYTLKQKGFGLGIDLGISYIKKKYTSDILIDTDVTYKWKLNASLLDLGQINYKDALVHHYQLTSTINPTLIDLDKASNEKTTELFFQNRSNQLYQDPTLSTIGNDFNIGLPTALNINFDYGFTDNIYLKTNWIQRIPLFKNSLQRSNVISVNGRYQKNWWGISGGITAYEYRNAYLGGSIRIGPLVIGSDNFIPLILPQKELQSVDLYFALKINSFWDNLWKRHKRHCCDRF